MVNSLGASADVDVDVEATRSSLYTEGQVRVEFERFKQRLQFVLTGKDMLSTLDACRLADFVLFVIAPDDVILGENAQNLLRVVESQGLSNVLVAVQVFNAATLPQVSSHLLQVGSGTGRSKTKTPNIDNCKDIVL